MAMSDILVEPLEAGVPFHPVVARWFRERFGQPTDPQRLGWRSIAAGRDTLIAAPTGSGKTLAAFLWCIDRLFRDAAEGTLSEGVQVIYVSPLKALSNDIHRNLEVPLAEIRAAAIEAGLTAPRIRSGVRTGDTPASERQAMIRNPPHILVTTPESLYLLLTSARSREILRSVKTVIVDEIHAMARDKRGSHLALSLERLAELCGNQPARIGLSATQRPIEEISRFLVGNRPDPLTGEPDCAIVDVGHARELDLGIEVPPSELAAVCSNECWAEIYERLVQLIAEHRSTLIFVNTRRLAERVSHHLIELLGEGAVASHHGSLSRATRLSAEERLKTGQLKAIVATASLEMGIDVGYLDLVCQIGSPRSIASFLQRVGRSGHSLGLVPKGRLFPLTRDELVECLGLVRAVRRGHLDPIEIPQAPLDILAQQIIAAVSADEWDEDELYALFCRAWPYRDLSREDYEATLELTTAGADPKSGRGAHLHRDRIGRRLRPRRGARLAALTSGGAIPEVADYRVVMVEDGTFVGTLNEDFAIESQAGDVFQLGNMSWRICYVRGSEVAVQDANGAPATVPFWLGEAPGRTWELSTEIGDIRQAVADRVEIPNGPPRSIEIPELDGFIAKDGGATDSFPEVDLSAACEWLRLECAAGDWAAQQAARYIAAQKAAIPIIPTQRKIVFERFFDEAGGAQLVIHAPLGARINRAWGLALRKRFCRSFDFELQAAATNDGVLLSLSPQHSFPIDALFKMLTPQNGKELLVQALLVAPLFQTRWRWNVTRALAVLRFRGGKKVPPFLQRHRSDDLLAAVFPETVGCLENHHGDVPIPNHPLVRQTFDDCLSEAMDIDGWLRVLGEIVSGEIELIPCDTREPSPFSHEIVNANPYAFLDGAPLEERRTRAVTTRRTLDIGAMRNLAWLDPAAIAQVVADAQPLVRDADELHDVLITQGILAESEGEQWTRYFDQLAATGRGTRVRLSDRVFWIAAENGPLVLAIWPDALAASPPVLPASVRQNWESAEALVQLVRGRMQTMGPIRVARLAEEMALSPSKVDAALVAIEGEGLVMLGHYSPPASPNANPSEDAMEWCDRRLLARIHRLTLDGLRRQIAPVAPTDYLRFLIDYQRVTPARRWHGPAGVREAIRHLQGFEMAAGAWERRVLPARVKDYDPAWLDQLAMSGELVWGRLRPFRPEESERPSASRLTRAAPLSLMLRSDLAWLLPPDRAPTPPLRSGAEMVLEALTARGALFHHDLLTVTGLLPSQLDESLLELAQLGMISADGIAPVRALSSRPRAKERDRSRRRDRAARPSAGLLATAGRWSLFPGVVPALNAQERAQHWAVQLLDRWGVVFRDLLTREAAAPPWWQLVNVLRRMEARGEVRGGRFVAGVGGEQYARNESVEHLRSLRDAAPSEDWLVVAGSDPLNLQGIITTGARVTAKATNSLALRNGKLMATLESGEVRFFDEFSAETSVEITRRLRRTG